MAEATQITGLPFQEALTRDGNGFPLGWRYHAITDDSTTEIKAGPGVLHSITFNKPVATSTITIYDQTSATGNVIGTITVPASPQPLTLFYDVIFTIGLTIVTGTTPSDITVAYI